MCILLTFTKTESIENRKKIVNVTYRRREDGNTKKEQKEKKYIYQEKKYNHKM